MQKIKNEVSEKLKDEKSKFLVFTTKKFAKFKNFFDFVKLFEFLWNLHSIFWTFLSFKVILKLWVKFVWIFFLFFFSILIQFFAEFPEISVNFKSFINFRPNPFPQFILDSIFVDLFIYPNLLFFFSLMLNKFAVWKRSGNEMSRGWNCHKSFAEIPRDRSDWWMQKVQLNGKWFIHFYRNLPWEILKSSRATHWSFNLRFQDAIKNKLAQTTSRRIKKLN